MFIKAGISYLMSSWQSTIDLGERKKFVSEVLIVLPQESTVNTCYGGCAIRYIFHIKHSNGNRTSISGQ